MAQLSLQIHLVAILLIAVGLAMDAFAVSIVTGSVYKDLHVKHAIRMALFFGGFQAVMPVIGFLAGLGMKEYISGVDHWVAFGLLSFVGGKMVYEAFQIESAEKNRDPSNLLILLALSIATSIDALAVGITLSLLTTCDRPGGDAHRRDHLRPVLRGGLHRQALRPLLREPDRGRRRPDPHRHRPQNPHRAPLGMRIETAGLPAMRSLYLRSLPRFHLKLNLGRGMVIIKL